MSLEKKAILSASIVALSLLILKLIVAIISGSIAILASAIDSFFDLAVSIFNYFALHTANKKADMKFNFGRGKIEAIAAVAEGVIIILSGFFIFYLSIKKIINNSLTYHLDISIYVMIAATLITLALILFLLHVAKKSNSLIIKADALHYKTDLITNIGTLLSLAIISLTKWHIIDAIAGTIIAIYIIYSALKLIKEGVLMLLDVALDPVMIKGIKEAINNQKEILSFHFLKTRRSGNDIFVNVHIVFDYHISLIKAHEISEQVDEDIEKIDTSFNWHMDIHLDPYDDSQTIIQN